MQEEGNEKLSSYVSYKPVGKALEEIAAGAIEKRETRCFCYLRR